MLFFPRTSIGNTPAYPTSPPPPYGQPLIEINRKCCWLLPLPHFVLLKDVEGSEHTEERAGEAQQNYFIFALTATISLLLIRHTSQLTIPNQHMMLVGQPGEQLNSI